MPDSSSSLPLYRLTWWSTNMFYCQLQVPLHVLQILVRKRYLPTNHKDIEFTLSESIPSPVRADKKLDRNACISLHAAIQFMWIPKKGSWNCQTANSWDTWEIGSICVQHHLHVVGISPAGYNIDDLFLSRITWRHLPSMETGNTRYLL